MRLSPGVRHFAPLFLAGLVVSACMPKVENQEAVPPPGVISHSVERVGQNANIVFKGVCHPMVVALHMSGESGGFQSVTKQVVQGGVVPAGVGVGDCAGGDLTVSWGVPKPTVNRRIDFMFFVQINDGRTSPEIVYSVDYKFPNNAIPGFAVLSGGGISSSNSMVLRASAGEVTGPVDLVGNGFTVKANLQGVLFE